VLSASVAPEVEHPIMPESESLAESSGVRPRIEPFDDDDAAPSPRPAPPAREGLPPGFRMRADAHYVDQLDTRMSSIPVRLIDTQSIDAAHQNGGDAVSPAFVESVRRFGILQPLLVSARGSRYRVIAGRRRLAAAAAAGLRDVPCLVQHVDGEQAEQMALASNVPATRPRTVTPAAHAAPASAAAATGELASSLTALASCADLMASGSAPAQAAAADLVRAEAARAMDLLRAVRVLRDEMPLARVRASAASILELVNRSHHDSRRGGPVRLRVDAHAVHGALTLVGDPGLLAGTLSSLAGVAASLIDVAAGRDTAPAVLTAAADGPDAIAFTVAQTAAAVPSAWLARPFEIAWPVRDGASLLVQLQAARRLAQAHGGDVRIDAADGGTAFVLSVPAAA
jgi:hypothetical protein